MQIQKIILVIIVIAGVVVFTAALAFWLNLLSNPSGDPPSANMEPAEQRDVCDEYRYAQSDISCNEAVVLALRNFPGTVKKVALMTAQELEITGESENAGDIFWKLETVLSRNVQYYGYDVSSGNIELIVHSVTGKVIPYQY